MSDLAEDIRTQNMIPSLCPSWPTLEWDESILEDADFDEIGDYILEKLDSVIARIARNRYISRNSRNSPPNMLCFAVGNKNALTPALGIAEYLLKD